MKDLLPAFDDILEAAGRIGPFIHKTPVLTSSTLNDISGSDLFFKCENFQKMGAFKMRGAMNALLSLNKKDASNGVATHSSGNFAQALSLSARILGLKAFIVMPSNSPSVKMEAVKGYGATVIECEPNLAARESTLHDVVQETGAAFVHPYNDMDVILGNSTAALELFVDTGDLDFIVAPVGGGGLISGTSLSSFHLCPECLIIGAEPAGADDAFRSLLTGTIQPSLNPCTIADGLKTSLGDITFPIIQRHVNRIIRVEEDEIISAMRLIWERMKIVVEPSGAITLAAVIKEKDLFKNTRTGMILSGGNVDLAKLPF